MIDWLIDWTLAAVVGSVMAAGLNDAGRGLNIVVVNPKTKDVIRVGHFDTFGSGLSSDSLTEINSVWLCL